MIVKRRVNRIMIMRIYLVTRMTRIRMGKS